MIAGILVGMKLATRPTVPRRLRWTVAEYFRLAETGLLDGRKVELIDGGIIELPAQATPHRSAVTKISHLLLGAFPPPGQWVVIQGTVRLSRHDAPDPDFTVFDAPVGTPDDQLLPPLLLIEVSDTTYVKDAGEKMRAYARSGVADYWIVNLIARRVEVYRRPENASPGRRAGWRYVDVTHHGPGGAVAPLLRPQLSFPVDQMLS
jgi:Uma2 family endonuclease